MIAVRVTFMSCHPSMSLRNPLRILNWDVVIALQDIVTVAVEPDVGISDPVRRLAPLKLTAETPDAVLGPHLSWGRGRGGRPLPGWYIVVHGGRGRCRPGL